MLTDRTSNTVDSLSALTTCIRWEGIMGMCPIDPKTAQVPVVRKLDSAIHRIHRYPEDKHYDNQLRYPLDSNLSSG